jgi:hypothetical protein
MSKFKTIGQLGIDTGRLLIADPAYVNEPRTTSDYSDAVLERASVESTSFDLALVIPTGMGDGVYPVEIKEEDGFVTELRIKFRIL